MSQQYASPQPAGFKNHVENIAIVGATGSVGNYFAASLLATQKHKITAITRGDITVPAGVTVAKVDYNDPSTLISALRGRHVLIITMAPRAPEETQTKLIDAAAEAGVPFVFPNEYGYDMTHAGLMTDMMNLGVKHAAYRAHIESRGVSAWIGLTCGFWYEFSLGGGVERLGIDFAKKEVTFFDEGETRTNTSTWPQCGRAMAGLLSLQVWPEDEKDKAATLSGFRNRFVCVSSFRVTQKEMFASALRVTGTREEEWKVGYQDSVERYREGFERLKKGEMLGFVQVMYSRVFWKDGSGDFESRLGLQNDVLGLPVEDLDEATKGAVEFAKGGSPYPGSGPEYVSQTS